MITAKCNADITSLTTFRVPAAARMLLEWDDVDDLRSIVADSELPRPFLAIGGGSNLLFTKPFEGTVILRRNQPTLDSLCGEMAAAGVWGFENLSGIPGTIYGAVVQNAGAYGTEMADVVKSVEAFDLELGQTVRLENRDLRFAYRHSLFKEPEYAGRYVIVDVEFETSASGPQTGHAAIRKIVGDRAEVTPMEVRLAVLALRDSKLPNPTEIGSAGSFFRNPELTPEQYGRFAAANPDAPHFDTPDGRVKVPAAWLIDRAGLKGVTEGGAIVWPSQPLVIANPEGLATASDVLTLERRIQRTVKDFFDIDLTAEVQHI